MYLKKPSLERKELVKVKKLEEEIHRATMAKEREKVKKKRKSKVV